jgi:hypothetical protein
MPNVHIGFSWDSDTVTNNISIISYWLMAVGMDGGLSGLGEVGCERIPLHNYIRRFLSCLFLGLLEKRAGWAGGSLQVGTNNICLWQMIAKMVQNRGSKHFVSFVQTTT